VAETIVGSIHSVSVRFTRQPGVFSRGPDTVQIQQVSLESGESGERFVRLILHATRANYKSM